MMLTAMIATVVLLAAPGRSAAAAPTNVPVTPAGGTAAFQSPTMAVDPGNPNHLAIAYHDAASTLECGLALSSDAGATWTSQVVVGTGGAIPLTGEEATCVDPRVAFGPGGVLYYLYQTNRTSFNPNEVLITTSLNGGATWGAPVLLEADSNRIVHAQVGMAVDDSTGVLYVGWTTNYATAPYQSVVVASSYDQGTTFSTPVTVNAPAETFPSEPQLLVAPDDTLYVAWREWLGPNFNANVLFTAASRDAGLSFSQPSLVFDHLDLGCQVCTRPVEYDADNVSAEVALGTSPGQLYAVGWGPPDGQATTDRRIMFASSQDGGTTWSATRVIAAPAGFANDDQARPSITVTPGGRIEIVYQDMPTANGPGNETIFEIHSDDGGATFSTPFQINAAPSDIEVGPGSFNTFAGGSTADLGAKLSVASSTSGAFAAWTDTSRGTVDTGKQDIFFAVLPAPVTPTPASPGPSPSPAPVKPTPSVAPTLSAVRLSHSRFAVAPAATPIAGTAAARPPRGTTFSYVLSEAATVKIAIAERSPGQRRGGKCVAPPSKKRRGTHRCTRILRKGTLTRKSFAARNLVPFSGRIGSRALPIGSYQATLTATNAAGQRSAAVTVRFTIVRA